MGDRRGECRVGPEVGESADGSTGTGQRAGQAWGPRGMDNRVSEGRLQGWVQGCGPEVGDRGRSAGVGPQDVWVGPVDGLIAGFMSWDSKDWAQIFDSGFGTVWMRSKGWEPTVQ